MNRYRALNEPVPVTPPPGKVYSSNPRIVDVLDEGRFVIKGPEMHVVFAELAAHELAASLRIDIPAYGICILPDTNELYFASREVGGRTPVDHYLRHDLLANVEQIPNTIVFDVWTGNYDRNVGNFVVEMTAGGLKALAIDFEKAAVLRGEPDRFTITAWDSKRFWPTGDLGRACERFEIPTDFCERIHRMKRETIEGILEQIRSELNFADIAWLRATVDMLEGRSNRIYKLVLEAWHG